MNTFLVACKACGSPVDTGVVDASRSAKRTSGPAWIPMLEVERACDACGHRARYSLRQSVLVAAVQ